MHELVLEYSELAYKRLLFAREAYIKLALGQLYV